MKQGENDSIEFQLLERSTKKIWRLLKLL